MIDACIIGVSGYGAVHYNALMQENELGTMRPLGATVINQDEEQEKCDCLRAMGCEIFTDYRDMLDRLKGRIDLCFIPTGIHLHAPMTVAALEAGAHVYVEKPVAATIQDVAAMQEAAVRADRIVAVGYQHMYAEHLFEFKQKLREFIGRPLAFKAVVGGARPDSYYARNAWAGKLKIGSSWVLDSPFTNAFAHRLNLLCFLAGEALADSARIDGVQAELYRARTDIESADTACLNISTADGPTVLYYVTHCPEGDPGVVEIRGENGTLRWEDNHPDTLFIPRSGEPQTVSLPWVKKREYPGIMERVRRRLSDGQTFVCELRHAGAHTRCVNGAYESSPIHRIGPEHVTRAPMRESQRTRIAGVDRIMSEAMRKECMFSELEVPWARPGMPVSLQSYRRFSGGAAAAHSGGEGSGQE